MCCKSVQRVGEYRIYGVESIQKSALRSALRSVLKGILRKCIEGVLRGCIARVCYTWWGPRYPSLFYESLTHSLRIRPLPFVGLLHQR